MNVWVNCRCGHLKPGKLRACWRCGHDPLWWLGLAALLCVALVPSCLVMCEVRASNGSYSGQNTPERVVTSAIASGMATVSVTETVANHDAVRAAALKCGATPWLVAEMLHLEQLAGVPAELRGMSLAAACHESRFSARVLSGTKRGDDGKARGLLQMWPWAKRYCGLDAPDQCGAGMHDPVRQAECWLGNVRRLVRVARQSGCADPWVAAWAFAASGPKGYRCRAPRHLSVLKRWQRE